MAPASAPPADLHDPSPPPPAAWASAGPIVVCAAALVVPLAYLPILNSVFAEPKLALLSVAGAAGLGLALVEWARGAPSRPRLSRAVTLAVAAWLATTLLAALVAGVRGAPGAPYARGEITRMLAAIGVGLGAAQAATDQRWRTRLLTSIQIGAGLVSTIGLLQHLQILPFDIPVISVPGSTFGNRNIAAEAIAMALPFGLAALASARREGTGQMLGLLMLQIIYLGATRTRGAWLGAASGVAVFYLLRRPAVSRAALAGGLVFATAALAAALIPGRVIPRDVLDDKRFEPGQHVVQEALDPASPVVRARLGLWRRTLAIYRTHPWAGVGPGNFVVFFPLHAEPGAREEGVMSPSVVPRRAHQDLLERLAETGPLGLLAWLAVLAAGGVVAGQRARRADRGPDGANPPTRAAEAAAAHDDAALAAGAAGSLAALFACGLTGFPLAMPATALLLGVALGFLACEGRGRAGAQPRRAWGIGHADADADADESDPSVGVGVDVSEGDRARARPWRRAPAARVRLVAALLAAAVLVAFTAVREARGLMRSYGLARARVALRGAGGWRAALVALQRAERSAPGRFDVALETGFVLHGLQRYPEALAAIDHALAVEPHSPNAWALRAEAALAAGDPARAAADAGRAVALLHSYADALATRARAGERLGDRAIELGARAELAGLAAQGDVHAAQLLVGLGVGREAR
jgi:O-antigen ligase